VKLARGAEEFRYVSRHRSPVASYVDLHAHFLPGLDDGARTLDEGLRMIAALGALGFEQVHATPHQRSGMFLPSREQIDAALGQVETEARRSHPGVKVGLAAENFWDEVLHERLGQGSVPSYPSGKAFLFEVNPQFMPPQIEQRLFQIRVGGRLPVMAHPERYLAVQQDPGRAEALGRSAALLVDLAALDGAHGRPAMKAARRLCEEGLAHAGASDVHTAEDQRPVAAGMAWLRKRLGPEALDRFLDENPRRILAGELP
jgi:protein-tyrosine phosphatase